MPDIKGRRIAILATDGVEEVELTRPAEALRNAGAEVEVVSPKTGEIQGMNHDKPGDTIPVDIDLRDARPDDYDALLLPGGVANPDTLRTIPERSASFRGFSKRTSRSPRSATARGP